VYQTAQPQVVFFTLTDQRPIVQATRHQEHGNAWVMQPMRTEEQFG